MARSPDSLLHCKAVYRVIVDTIERGIDKKLNEGFSPEEGEFTFPLPKTAIKPVAQEIVLRYKKAGWSVSIEDRFHPLLGSSVDTLILRLLS